MKKKLIVISAVSLFSGGTLSILFDCLSELNSNFSVKYSIIAFTHKSYSNKFPNIHFVPIPWARKTYFHKLFVEYFLFNKISKRLNPYLWFSLHDITPSVNAERIAVYCHHPSPFYKLSLKEYLLDAKFVFFSKVYSFFYKRNIHKNYFVIVQQSWLRDIFSKKFDLLKSKIIVAHPSIPAINEVSGKEISEKLSFIDNVKYFIYPSFPRVFKNFEIICQAVQLLNKAGYNDRFRIIFTISGTENFYSKWIKRKYSTENIIFLGRITREQVFSLYKKSDLMIFPSKLETWGLPLTEYKYTNKPILTANLEYSKEAIGSYSKVSFFNSENSTDLFHLIKQYLDGNISYTGNIQKSPDEPYTSSWNELLNKLTE